MRFFYAFDILWPDARTCGVRSDFVAGLGSVKAQASIAAYILPVDPHA
jgi:hypothetical protein